MPPFTSAYVTGRASGVARAHGRVELLGEDLLSLPAREMRKVRGARVGMIFQEPMTALNPVLTAGDQIGESLRHHRCMSRAAERAEVLRLMDLVRIPDSRLRIDQYPHELSGGMRQRVMIAAAIACRPVVLLADEPTTALDVTNQIRVLQLLRDLQREVGMALLLITHDLGVVAHVADRVAVMYAGEIVELAPVQSLFEAPRHPYSEALLRSMPRADRDQAALETIPGQVPALGAWSAACRFSDRCPFREQRCEAVHPALLEHPTSRTAARCVVRNAYE
jgi:peptide/nickel transport system ATP-binding protein